MMDSDYENFVLYEKMPLQNSYLRYMVFRRVKVTVRMFRIREGVLVHVNRRI